MMNLTRIKRPKVRLPLGVQYAQVYAAGVGLAILATVLN
jgi:hypothetical protein